ncbi:ferrous iron transport protein A [Methanothermobacter sp.]|uniref:FeoA family protein n=1 Tax=Methanothermobacter sp. TaxID=1884223 RepID=UPI002634F550|nr:ferrous iron transport protein A [Methanothermobacter sp.]MDI9614724.1 ferrous iron transport protein A [Methanothermobacter sp.]
METTLDRISESERVTVTSVDIAGKIKHRFTVMGIVRGSRVTIEKVAPLGDPLKVRVRGHPLSIRRKEASRIRVRRD